MSLNSLEVKVNSLEKLCQAPDMESKENSASKLAFSDHKKKYGMLQDIKAMIKDYK